jgi:ribosomal protein L11 methylase PrmA
MKRCPAIDVRTDAPDLLLAIVDDFGPTAVEERDASVRIFFSTLRDRDEAQRALTPRFEAAAVDVDDEDWARRSQENLKPITVGRITVAPPWAAIDHDPSAISHPASAPSETDGGTVRLAEAPEARRRQPSAIEVVILPSMGFGTGHHVTTRLCLAALQTLDLTDRDMLDVGTGSGVLAIAADRLGAARALGIDDDEDAIQSARENLDLNPDARHVTFELVDLAADALPVADVVTANLTGALLVRSAAALLAAVRSGGTLILSGVQSHERDEVREGFAGTVVCWERDEDGWVGLAVKKS